MVEWWVAWFTTLAAAALGWFWHWHVQQVARRNGAETAEKILQDARHEADICLREARTQAQSRLHEARNEFELETKERRGRLEALEDKHHERLMRLEEKSSSLDAREESINQRAASLQSLSDALAVREEELTSLETRQQEILETLSGCSREEARSELRSRLEDEVKSESAQWIRQVQQDLKSRSRQEAQKILTLAMERYAAETVQDVTATAIHLPSEEMKGRIIGKEGRNIRSIESATGVNVVIDDTPQTVTLSGYDPMRREIARISVERLVADGRIHPTSIEETVERVRAEVEDTVQKAGENAVYDLGLSKVAPEIVYTLGRLKYRQSYSQNVLNHSIEMAHIMGSIAAELGLDIHIAKRIGLMHDIGKALTHEVEGSHALIGADLLRKHGEEDLVVNAVAAHHREVEPESVYAHLAMAADAVTAARPGARNENTEHYLKRLSDLETIANSFEGVHSSYAIQAGRELRVLVEPKDVSDDEAVRLARDISGKIEHDVQFPGQIKVTVIRETRSIDYAR
jgi:ribonuclease Y